MSSNAAKSLAAVGDRPRAVIYARQSLTRDGSESLPVQLAECGQAAERFGLDVVAELVEPPSTSGYKNRGKDRPRFLDLVAMVRRGEVDVVMVAKTDRLSRGGGPGWAPIVEAGEAAGLHPDRFIATPGGFVSEFEIGIRATTDREESKKLSERMRSIKASAATNGRANGGGRRPFGYTDNKFAAVIPAEAEILREARRRVVGGEAVNAVARDLDARGITTSTAARWTGQKLGRTLRSPHLAGLRVHGDETHPGNWPAIFTIEEREQILLAAGEHRPASVSRHLLTGFLLCGACLHPMRSKTTNQSGPRYDCRRCGAITISATFVEDIIGAAVVERLDSPAVVAALADASGNRSLRQVTDKLAADQVALEQLSRDHYVDRIIGREVFLAAQAPLAASIEAGSAKLKTMRSSVVGAVIDPAAAWASGDLGQRREVLAALVHTITIAPVGRGAGSKPKPERISVSWRV